MAILNNTPQYYYEGNDYGNYQFVSLTDVINQFMLIYVGEDKIIQKAKRLDVAFFAQRALAELSFDTFKSCKAQEITVPASLQMILPQDYVNYTKVSTVDSAGIKHLLYPISKTSNPISINQDDDGNYTFPTEVSPLINADFSETFGPPWFKTLTNGTANATNIAYTSGQVDQVKIKTSTGEFMFTHHVNIPHNDTTLTSNNKSNIYAIWQKVDVTGIPTINLSAEGTAAALATDVTGGTLRVGISSVDPTGSTRLYYEGLAIQKSDLVDPPWAQTLAGNDGYLEWTAGEDSTKSLNDTDAIDVSLYDTVWVLVTSVVDFSTASTTEKGQNFVDNLELTIPFAGQLDINTPGSSTTWSNYKSATPSENQDDYMDETYWPADGSRFGLDPQHAQANGSFYIDCVGGKIHFSSNISGKTVILDYISDSLGTDEEMQVHKFAEEAMYKWISYAILSGKANIPEQIVQRLKRERFAETRKAKLRLSNIKLEELTQILRGKSKQIKH